MIPQYNTKLFTDIYEDVDSFINDYNSVEIPNTISEATAKSLYYLLYAKYGNNPISNYDENQFKYRLFSIIFQYGPTWEKRLQIQDRLRSMSEDELLVAGKSISNSAYNPDTDPTTDELSYINQQNVVKQNKSYIGAYAQLWEILKTDVTEEFLIKFKKLFRFVVYPDHEYIYITEEN